MTKVTSVLALFNKQLKKGEKIPQHTHKYKELFFTVVSGKNGSSVK